jgi:TRAP-type C4-dicarboxylate transport system permease small subunit
MNSIRIAVDLLTKILEWFITLCFFVVLVLTILLVILRYGFNEAIIGGNEVMEYLFIYTTAIGAAAALGRRQHIKITWFVDKLSPVYRKIVDSLAFLLIALINGVMIHYSVPWIRTVGDFKSPVLRLPNRLIQIIIPVGCGLVIFYCLYYVPMIILGADPKLEKEFGE